MKVISCSRLCCSVHILCSWVALVVNGFTLHIEITPRIVQAGDTIYIQCVVNRMNKEKERPVRLLCPTAQGNNDANYCYENCSPTCKLYSSCNFAGRCTRQEFYRSDDYDQVEPDVKYNYVFRNVTYLYGGNYSCRYASQSSDQDVTFLHHSQVIPTRHQHDQLLSWNKSEPTSLSDFAHTKVFNWPIYVLAIMAFVMVIVCLSAFLSIRCILKKKYNGHSSKLKYGRFWCIKRNETQTISCKEQPSDDYNCVHNKYSTGRSCYEGENDNIQTMVKILPESKENCSINVINNLFNDDSITFAEFVIRSNATNNCNLEQHHSLVPVEQEIYCTHDRICKHSKDLKNHRIIQLDGKSNLRLQNFV